MGLNIDDLTDEVNEMRMDQAEVRVLTRNITGYIELYRDAITVLVEIADNFEFDDPAMQSKIDDLLDRVEAYDANPAA
jgi:hypothetical protein